MRIKQKDLEVLVDKINKVQDCPLTTYTLNKGKYTANIGNYHLSFAYGGVSLRQLANKDGGASEPLNTGHIPKKALYNVLKAFLAGLETKKG